MGSLSNIIIGFGYIGLVVAVFAESGFFLGFFLPGDSLIFTVGVLAAKNIFSIYVLLVLLPIAAILGDSFGYWMGKYFGHGLFSRKDSKFFKKEYVERTEEFFKKYGKKTILLARFVPIIRTFAPVMAGIGEMEYFSFLSYNVIGGAIWSVGFLLIGYILGLKIPNIQQSLGYIIAGIVILSVLPIAIDFWKRRKNRKTLNKKSVK